LCWLLCFVFRGLSFPPPTPGQGPLRRVRVALNKANPLVTRVVLDLDVKSAFNVRPSADGREVTITLASQTGSAPSVEPTPVEAPAATPTVPEATSPVASGPHVDDTTDGKGIVSAAASPMPATPAMPEAASPVASGPYVEDSTDGKGIAPPAAASSVPATPAQAAARSVRLTAAPSPRIEPAVTARRAGDTPPKEFTGKAVSLDFQGVDLRAVLRTFATEITGLNFVIDPDVKGIVDVSLHEVPWDQALDIILRANQLDYTVENRIVRVAPVDVLRAEGEARRKLADEQALSGELVTITRTLNHAKAQDLATLLSKTALTKRSQIDVDERTNTLIITDLQLGIDRATRLITELDAPQPQVEIEARIVRTTKQFAKELGIKWGFSGKMAPELGNTTTLTFPSSVVGNATAGAVNTSADNASVSLGALNGALRIDAALSALESEGKVHVLLRPRVVTQNNIKATITRGEEIPYVTLTAPPATGGVDIIQPTPQVSFKTAALNLSVVPRISASGTVILEFDVDNGSRGTQEANGNVSINTQRVQTTVLVKDQATTVIGGIYETFDSRSEDRTPGLYKVPFIGRLFKRHILDENEGELLIFITPRILKEGQVAQLNTSAVRGAGK
jgi:type IV pilus assembly protein PilQ